MKIEEIVSVINATKVAMQNINADKVVATESEVQELITEIQEATARETIKELDSQGLLK